MTATRLLARNEDAASSMLCIAPPFVVTDDIHWTGCTTAADRTSGQEPTAHEKGRPCAQ